MRARYRPLRALTVVVAAALVFGAVTSASADDYPSWDEVEAARQNEAAAASAVNEIEGILVSLEIKAAELGRAAQLKGELYNSARDQLDAASAKASRLETQATDAAQEAAVSSRRAGQLVAQLARTGGGDLGLGIFLSSDAGDLLSALGAMGKLSEQSTMIYELAMADRNLAQSLTDQARVAEARRQKLASDAQSALDAAQAASGVAQQNLATQQAAAGQLYDQLASLKGTTADTERQYVAGLADQQPSPPPTVPPSPQPTNPVPPPTTPPTTPPTIPDPTPTQPPPPPPTPVDPTPPPPQPSAVDGAIAFAYAQLGEPYVYGGYGPYGWDCSGLTKAAYASVGVYIGVHGSTSQYNYLSGQGRLVPVAQRVPGDLLFYSDGGTTWGTKYHTTLYIGNGLMIEAQYEGIPVKVSQVRYYDLVPYAARPTG